MGLAEEEQEVRRQALYIIDNLNLVNLALRLCDFKDIHMAVEAKQVSLPSALAARAQSHALRRSDVDKSTLRHQHSPLYSTVTHEVKKMPLRSPSSWQLLSQALHLQACMNAGAIAVAAGQIVLCSCNLPCAGT